MNLLMTIYFRTRWWKILKYLAISAATISALYVACFWSLCVSGWNFLHFGLIGWNLYYFLLTFLCLWFLAPGADHLLCVQVLTRSRKHICSLVESLLLFLLIFMDEFDNIFKHLTNSLATQSRNEKAFHSITLGYIFHCLLIVVSIIRTSVTLFPLNLVCCRRESRMISQFYFPWRVLSTAIGFWLTPDLM